MIVSLFRRIKSAPLRARGYQVSNLHIKLKEKSRDPNVFVCMSLLMEFFEPHFIECAAWPGSSLWSIAVPLVTLVGPADLWLGRMGAVCCGSASLAEKWGQCVCGMNKILPCCYFMTGHGFTAKTESGLMVIYCPLTPCPCEVHLCELCASCF